MELDTSGGLDAAFNVGAGFPGPVLALATAGTSVYVGGVFGTYRGGSATCVAKLDKTTGALDTTFSPPGAGLNGFPNPAYEYINAFAISGSSLLLCGDFNRYRGAAPPRRNAVAVNLVSGALQ